MPFDFKKEYKELYAPKAVPSIVTVPPMKFVAVDGRGDPNAEGGEYKLALNVLYAVAYTLKMSYKTDYKIPGFYEYVVPPLEGFWRQDGADGIDYADKSGFRWTSVLRLPDFVRAEDFSWAAEAAAKKKKLDCSGAYMLALEEGLCVQAMHLGSYDSEPETVAKMDEFILVNGYENDMDGPRRHHEIYLSDPNKIVPERRKTVIRHPIRRGRPEGRTGAAGYGAAGGKLKK